MAEIGKKQYTPEELNLLYEIHSLSTKIDAKLEGKEEGLADIVAVLHHLREIGRTEINIDELITNIKEDKELQRCREEVDLPIPGKESIKIVIDLLVSHGFLSKEDNRIITTDKQRKVTALLLKQ